MSRGTKNLNSILVKTRKIIRSQIINNICYRHISNNFFVFLFVYKHDNISWLICQLVCIICKCSVIDKIIKRFWVFIDRTIMMMIVMTNHLCLNAYYYSNQFVCRKLNTTYWVHNTITQRWYHTFWYVFKYINCLKSSWNLF